MKKKVLITWLLLAVTGVLHAQELADTLDASRISALREKTRNTTQTGLMHIESKQLTSGIAVFGTPDVIKKLQLLPGVAAGNELMSGLYVHGGDGNDNLFLLDGVPLYNISHFGGLFSSFNTDIIDNLDFYKSGFPARYGGRMSSVVDVETREGNMKEYHGSASLGLIDGRVQVEGPIVKEKTSFNVGLRRTWMDVVTIPAIWYANRRNGPDQTVGGGYAMWDINARVTHRFAPGNVLNACFYTGADDLRASLETKDASNMKLGVKWGSLTGSVSHFYEFSKKLKVKTALYYTQSTSDTGYNFGFRSEKEGVVTRNTMDDKDIASVREVGLTSNWDWYPNQYNHVRYGLSAQYHWYHSGRTYASSAEEDGVPTSKNGDDVSQGYRAFEPAVYAEDEIFLRYNLTLNAGLRFALFATPGKTYPSLEPRVAFKWLINNSISAKLSYTRMSQFAHLVSAVYMDLPSNSWMPSTAHAKPMVSDQVAGGIYTSFGPFTFNLEGWYKTMENVLWCTTEATLLCRPSPNGKNPLRRAGAARGAWSWRPPTAKGRSPSPPTIPSPGHDGTSRPFSPAGIRTATTIGTRLTSSRPGTLPSTGRPLPTGTTTAATASPSPRTTLRWTASDATCTTLRTTCSSRIITAWTSAWTSPPPSGTGTGSR